jgi:glucose-6-phosphate 1-dehydrogenase
VALQAKVSGEAIVTQPVDLGFTYDQVFGTDRMEAYERLLPDAIEGQTALPAREDGVEQAWRVVAPVLKSPGTVHLYEPGSWGLPEAVRLVADDGGWHPPTRPPAVS